jgi:hypothetical protein
MPPRNTFRFPLCDACQAGLRRREVKGVLAGIAVGWGIAAAWVILSTAAGWSNCRWSPDVMGKVWDFLFGASVVCLPLLPLCVPAGYVLGRRPPVKVRRSSPRDGTVQLYFRRPDCAEAFLAAVRAVEQKLGR